jgi:hypothetical protein
MHKMYQDGNILAKPDTITYNVVRLSFAVTLFCTGEKLTAPLLYR